MSKASIAPKRSFCSFSAYGCCPVGIPRGTPSACVPQRDPLAGPASRGTAQGTRPAGCRARLRDGRADRGGAETGGYQRYLRCGGRLAPGEYRGSRLVPPCLLSLRAPHASKARASRVEELATSRRVTPGHRSRHLRVGPARHFVGPRHSCRSRVACRGRADRTPPRTASVVRRALFADEAVIVVMSPGWPQRVGRVGMAAVSAVAR
jgi:hypothetical protein